MVTIKSIKTGMIDFKEAPLELKFFLYFVISLIFLDMVLIRFIEGNIPIVLHSFAGGPLFNSFYACSSIVVIAFITAKGRKKIFKSGLLVIFGLISFGLIFYDNYNHQLPDYYPNKYRFIWTFIIPIIWVLLFLFSQNIRTYLKKSIEINNLLNQHDLINTTDTPKRRDN